MLEQPGIAAPPFANVTVPHRAVLLVPAVTVAMSVTFWLVTGALGVSSSSVVVRCDASGGVAALTIAVSAVGTGVLPPGPFAVTTQMIVLPMSAAESA